MKSLLLERMPKLHLDVQLQFLRLKTKNHQQKFKRQMCLEKILCSEDLGQFKTIRTRMLSQKPVRSRRNLTLKKTLEFAE
jgi:hypothetical protein